MPLTAEERKVRRAATQAASYRRWKAKYPERASANSTAWRIRNYSKFLYKAMVQNAQKRSNECTLTLQQLEELMAPMVCAVTGIPLTLESEFSTKQRNPWAPSPDRIDCSVGYVPGNVRIVCWAYNMARGLWPDDVVLTMARALVEKVASP